MATNDLQPDDAGATKEQPYASKTRRAFSRLKRELSDDELASPGTQKMVLEELERLSEENSSLQSFRDRFYESDKKCGILSEKFKSNIQIEILSGACLAIGAAAIVYAPVVWEAHQPYGWIALLFGVALTIAGISAKAIRL